MAESYALFGNGTFCNTIIKQTYAVAVGRVNASQKITLIGTAAGYSFRNGFQFSGIEKVVQERIPFCQTE